MECGDLETVGSGDFQEALWEKYREAMEQNHRHWKRERYAAYERCAVWTTLIVSAAIIAWRFFMMMAVYNLDSEQCFRVISSLDPPLTTGATMIMAALFGRCAKRLTKAETWNIPCIAAAVLGAVLGFRVRIFQIVLVYLTGWVVLMPITLLWEVARLVF